MKRFFIYLALVCLVAPVYGQSKEKKAPENWFNLDPKKDKVYGVGTERAYKDLLKGKTSQTVIVAVIDAGADIYHEDLKGVIWTNKLEIPGNGVDDDRNGYVDDVHGWNFIGGKNPDSNVNKDTYELTRLYVHYTEKYGNVPKEQVLPEMKADYEKYEKVKRAYEGEKERYSKGFYKVAEFHKGMLSVTEKLGKDQPGLEEVRSFKPANEREEKGKQALEAILSRKVDPAFQKEDLSSFFMLSALAMSGSIEAGKAMITELLDYYSNYLNYHYNTSFDPRKTIVKDDYNRISDIRYGNNNVKGPASDHGSHVSGIIAASRHNGLGMDGVADNVKIMVLRVVPDGDERDKDVANAIRYAADNGARIINMSFGKSWSWDKKAVDDAVKYASDKDVLLVHAAGNDSKDLEKYNNFPNDRYESSLAPLPNWIEVGASSWEKGKNLTAPFSNYGSQSVDLFAPGVSIYSTIPDTNKYASFDGTSMAAPVTSGVAALIRSYYPGLSAAQVKDIMMKSVTPVKKKVLIPGDKETSKLKKLCVSGGVVNVYNALKLAENYR